MKRSTIIVRALFALFVFAMFAHNGQASDNYLGNNDTISTGRALTSSSGFIIALDPSINVNEKGIKAGLLYDADNKKIVWQKEMDDVLPIASLTKMMVALLAIEDIHAGKVKWDDVVHWTRETVMRINRKNQTVYTQETYNVKDLFKAAMIASNNECAEALARYLEGGDEQAAIDRMNLRARELGMNNTWYGNPTGLPAASAKHDNVSTPEDLLLLALEMVKYNDILQVTGMGYADVCNGKSIDIISNHNHLTIDYSGDVDGMKTGYTRHAGFCLVATSKTCNHRLISIVLGARSPDVRNNIVANMLNDYYSSVGEEKLTQSQSPNAPIETTLYTGKEEEATDSGSVIYETKITRTLHTVNKGETLANIADKYDCPLADLKKWNRIHSSYVKPGRKLIVYARVRVKDDFTAVQQATAVKETANEVTMPPAKPAPKATAAPHAAAKENYAVYIVQPGDTLAKIAQNYNGVTIQQIKALNHISNSRALRVGAKLKVPVNT